MLALVGGLKDLSWIELFSLWIKDLVLVSVLRINFFLINNVSSMSFSVAAPSKS